MPSLLFAGAAENVTGSRHLLRTKDFALLLDCGMFQGSAEDAAHLNRELAFEASEPYAVLLSHGHLDHCGALPVLVKNGFKGTIWSTDATRDVAEAIMLDSAKVMLENYEYAMENRPDEKHLPPPYSAADVAKTMERFRTVAYGENFNPARNCTATFFDAGHIIGSSLVQIKTGKETLLYTGDIGRKNAPTLRDPEQIERADTLIMEATYGNREHRGYEFAKERIAKAMHAAKESGGKIVAPAFALGRTQILLAFMFELIVRKRAPSMPIIVDSPLADRMTEIYGRYEKYFDSETRALMRQREHPFSFPELRCITSREDSRALNSASGPLIIISSSGMAESGRIKHHIAHAITNPKNIILITGFMAANTLGRRIVEREQKVRIFSEWYPNRAQMEDLRGLSAHADVRELTAYAKNIKGLKRIFIVHGEKDGIAGLQRTLQESIPSAKTLTPFQGQQITWE